LSVFGSALFYGGSNPSRLVGIGGFDSHPNLNLILKFKNIKKII